MQVCLYAQHKVVSNTLNTFSALSHLRAEGARKTLSCFKCMFLRPHESILGPGSVLAAVHCDTAGGKRGTKYLYRTHLTQYNTYSYCQAHVQVPVPTKSLTLKPHQINMVSRAHNLRLSQILVLSTASLLTRTLH